MLCSAQKPCRSRTGQRCALSGNLEVRRPGGLVRAEPAQKKGHKGLSPLCPSPTPGALIPSTNTRPSRSESVRTMAKPLAASAALASPDAANDAAPARAPEAGRFPTPGPEPKRMTRPPGRSTPPVRQRPQPDGRRSFGKKARGCHRRPRGRCRPRREGVGAATSISTSTPACRRLSASPPRRQVRPPRHVRKGRPSRRWPQAAPWASRKRDAIAHFHARHADGQQVGVGAARERIHKADSLPVGSRQSAVGSRQSAVSSRSPSVAIG